MSREDVQDRLSGISTDWDMLRQVHRADAEAPAAATSGASPATRTRPTSCSRNSPSRS